MEEESQCQSGRRPTLREHGGNHPAPRAPTLWVHPRLVSSSHSSVRERKREPPRRPTSNSTSGAKLHGPGLAGFPRKLGTSRNGRFSNEKRPPNSPDKTTRWALPRSPTNSGFRVSLRRLATVRRQTSPCELAQTSCSPSPPPTLAPQAPVPRPSRKHKTPPRQS